MPRPVVSIIMPTFQSQRYIEEALDSVISQTFPKWELIVVDGGSRDDTMSIVARYAERDPRIRLIRNYNDRGPAHARATGVRAANGVYIAFLDGDDIWLPNKIGTQLNFMESGNYDFSYTYYGRISPRGEKLHCAIPAYGEYGYWKALAFRGIGTLTVMLRRSLLNDDILSRDSRKHGEDYLWWCLVLRNGSKAVLVPKMLAYYRNTATSLSDKRLTHLRSVWQAYRIELELSTTTAIPLYASYLIDAAIRALRVRICGWLTSMIAGRATG